MSNSSLSFHKQGSIVFVCIPSKSFLSAVHYFHCPFVSFRLHHHDVYLYFSCSLLIFMRFSKFLSFSSDSLYGVQCSDSYILTMIVLIFLLLIETSIVENQSKRMFIQFWFNFGLLMVLPFFLTDLLVHGVICKWSVDADFKD